MISVHPLARGAQAAEYYLNRQPGDLGYYIRRDQLPGRWIGSGAAAMGLVGGFDRPDADTFRGFLAGLGIDGTQLVGPVLRHGGMGRSIDVRRSGFDVTISAPKSVSVLYALAESAVAEQVALAHRLAAADALDVLERLTARAARGHQGDGLRAMRIPTTGLIGAAFDHDTSRALDPQLHTHVVVANLVRGVDGRWSALDSQTLIRQATTVSHLYHVRLRAELTHRLGVSWTPVKRGVAEIEGIPRDLCRTFSKRRVQIEQAMQARGHIGNAAARVACLVTRRVKRYEDPGSLRARWLAEAAQAGFDSKTLARLIRPGRLAPVLERDAVVARVLGPDGVTRERSTFDRSALVREICQHLPPGANVSTATVLGLAGEVLHDHEVVPVLTREGIGYSTLDLIAVEQHALDIIATRQREQLAVVDETTIADALRLAGLRPDQVALVTSLTGSGRGVEVVAGPAGSGKTRALATATEAWTKCGIDVRGVAVAAITADGLQLATGVPAASLARLMADPGRHLPTRGVLLLDEAGMVGTRQLARLIDATRAAGCKLVLVGDPAQLPEMEAGGLFGALASSPTAVTLQGHHRQVEPWEAEALTAIRDGRTSEALGSYADHGRLHSGETVDAVRETLVDDYLRQRAAATDPRQVLILARTKAQTDQLNEAVRQRLLTARALGVQSVSASTERGSIEFREGDEVIVTRNLYDKDLFNGTRATVTGLSLDELTLRTDDGRNVGLDRRLLRHGFLDHGYALTIHKAQGLTVDHALLWADHGLYQEAGYVGLSRAREATHVYLALRFEPTDDIDCGVTDHRSHDVEEREHPLSRGLENSHRQHLALDQQYPDSGYGRSL